MTRKHRLLQINSGDKGGGAHLVAFDIHQSLRAEGWDCKMIVGDKKSNDKDIAELRSPRFLTYLNLLFGIEFLFYVSSFKIKKRIAYRYSDIVHFHNLHGYFFNLFALPQLANTKPAIWTFHDMWPILAHSAHSFDCARCETGKLCSEHKHVHPKLYIFDTSPLLYRLKKYLLKKSNFIIVVPSLWLKSKVENSFLKGRDIRVIPNGIDTDIFFPMPKLVRKELDLPSDKRIVLFAASGGLNNPWKGSGHFLKLAKTYLVRKDILFVSIGGISEDAKKYSNIKQVEFITNREILAKYYCASDLFVNPTSAESFGLSNAEAMACGLPVLTFSVGATKEIIRHGTDGWLAKENDYQDLARSFIRLIDDEDLLTRMSQHATTRIINDFSKKKMVESYRDLYLEVLGL